MKFLTKVVPISKSTGCSLEESRVWAKGKEQGFLYVLCRGDDEKEYILSNTPNHSIVDEFFLESDLIPYEEPKAKESGKGMFVELHSPDKEPMLINVHKIFGIFSEENGNRIIYNEEDAQETFESYEAIKILLTDKGLML